MKRRTFIKTSAGLSGALFSSLPGCNEKSQDMSNEQLSNWAGNISYSTRKVYYPTSMADIIDIISGNKKLKCLGSRHSFSKVADTDGALISTTKMNSILSFDENAKTVTVEPGITYGELAVYLQQKGYALQNLASLPHISVAGACATATHGSGDNNSVLASSVVAFELIDGQGGHHKIRADQGELFNGSIINLGALGIVTSLTLSVTPDYSISQIVYKNLPFEKVSSNFDAIMSSGYSVSLFTSWSAPVINQVWVKKIFIATDSKSQSNSFYDAEPSDVDVHPVELQSAENVTTQRGIPGPWFERLPHFKMGFKPSTGKELQSEFFVDRENAVDAITAMQSLGPIISPHLLISEIRSVKADDFWMSPAYKKNRIAIHTTWKQTEIVEKEMIPKVQQTLEKFGAVPHWAKLSQPATSNAGLPARIEDFRELCKKFDPEKKFVNDYLQRYIFNSQQ